MPQDRVSAWTVERRPDLRKTSQVRVCQVIGSGSLTGMPKLHRSRVLNRGWRVRFAEATGDFPSPGSRGRPSTGRPFEWTNPFKIVYTLYIFFPGSGRVVVDAAIRLRRRVYR